MGVLVRESTVAATIIAGGGEGIRLNIASAAGGGGGPGRSSTALLGLNIAGFEPPLELLALTFVASCG